ncbi:hypothetical protein ACIA9I_34910 [Streptomyces anulatus]
MSTAPEPIRITRGRGGQVEVEGTVDSLAWQLLSRAGFLSEPTLNGRWIRLPFDMGEDWENGRAAWAAQMLATARFTVQLGPELTPVLPARPSRPPCPLRSHRHEHQRR